MRDELTRSRDHLAQHRRMIIGRSLATSIAGVLPVPLFDEWLSAAITRGTIRRIAESRGVDMDEDAIRAIADGSDVPPSWTNIVGGGVIFKLLARQWRKLVLAIVAARRARAAARAFTVATLFDHYCSRVHVGIGLDGESASRVRAYIDRAITDTPGGLTRHMFRRSLVSAARASLRAPVELANVATGGFVSRLLKSGDEVEAVERVDDALERQLRSEKSFLTRSAVAVELQLAGDTNPYLDDLLDHFERLWRNRPEDAGEG